MSGSCWPASLAIQASGLRVICYLLQSRLPPATLCERLRLPFSCKPLPPSVQNDQRKWLPAQAPREGVGMVWCRLLEGSRGEEGRGVEGVKGGWAG